MTGTLERHAAAPSTGYRTLATRVMERAAAHPDRVAMREKDLGLWQEITWAELAESVLDAAHGLLALGAEVGDRVSIQSEDRPEWVILDLATVAIGAVTVGLYPTNPASEVKYLLQDSGARIHLAEDQEQADKVMGVIGELPEIAHIIHVEPRGFRSYRDDPRFLFWDAFLDVGRQHRIANPHAVDARMAAIDGGDIMTLVYTSGTTGPPKGAMLTHANVEFCIETLIGAPGRIPKGGPINDQDLVLTYLPLCHVAERIFSTFTMVAHGAMLNFAESIETVQANLREVQPTLFFAVPRIWEKIHASVLIKAGDATLIKRLVFRAGIWVAGRVGRMKVANEGSHTVASRALSALTFPVLLRPLRDRIGLRRCRWAASGAAPIAPEVLEFFVGIGVPVHELYGMTENVAVATNNFAGRMKLGTVGEPYANIGFRLDPDTGEIQTKHDANFLGYWNRPEATAATFTEDGWLKTGDIGEWVDGTHVKVVDRIKDIIVTSGGKNIAPSEIENRLKASPYIKEAMVIGDRRNYLAALVGIELDTVGNWALRRKIPYTTYHDLSMKPEVIELVQGIISEVNAGFARAENIRKFRLIPKELDHEDGELTATQKIKRASMEEMFSELIEEMYG